MSLVLTTYPVEEKNGKVYNIFAGFSPVEIQFQRQDIDIVSVGEGAGSKVEITVSGDITSFLNVGEWIYLSATSSEYEYDNSAKITSILYSAPNTVILVDLQYIATATTGYINYFQNYFVEAKIVDVDNNNVQLYPDLLSDDGTPSGVVKINVSGTVDYLSNEILTTSGEVTDSRIRFVVMYREVYRENQTNVFTLLDETPIIVIYAADNSEPERFVNDFEIPRIYEGYPFSIAFLRSYDNNNEPDRQDRITITFDELDINQDVITEDNQIHNFKASEFGVLQANFADKIKTIEDNTRYIQFNASAGVRGDYKAGDYKSGDYFTGE